MSIRVAPEGMMVAINHRTGKHTHHVCPPVHFETISPAELSGLEASWGGRDTRREWESCSVYGEVKQTFYHHIPTDCWYLIDWKATAAA